MTPSRREFIRSLGIALAAVALSRCAPPTDGGGAQDPHPPTPTPLGGEQNTLRGQLRDYWQQFDWLIQRARDWENPEAGNQAREELLQGHRAVLDGLVELGALEPAVADLVQEAYAAAVYHVWRSHTGMTCYIMVQSYQATVAGQLVQQSELLAEITAGGEVDPAVVSRVRESIERDMAYLDLADEARQKVDSTPGFPSLEEIDFDVSPEAAAAARFLLELLLEA
jgi:hypothetical protein